MAIPPPMGAAAASAGPRREWQKGFRYKKDAFIPPPLDRGTRRDLGCNISGPVAAGLPLPAPALRRFGSTEDAHP